MEERMKSTGTWESEALELATGVQAEGRLEPQQGNNIITLKELTLRLLREVQSIGEVQSFSLEDGLDFYDEVSRFEIDLIKRALAYTGGHQGRAARLLNLKVTTLNTKIKNYNIILKGFANGYPLVDTDKIETRQPA